MIEIRVVPESLMDDPAVQHAVKLLSRVDYRERSIRWEIRRLPEGLGFAAVFMVYDANEPGKKVEIYSPVQKLRQPDENFLGACHKLLLDFAQHEVNEHFYVDGVKRFDPHRSYGF